MVVRGGTSKGAYFVSDDLPADPAERDDLLLRALGSPDPRQIDGIGGAHPLTSKVAIVSPSARPGVDVDYLFLQVAVDEPSVSDRQNCGNLLAGVGPFALERGLVGPPSTPDGKMSVRIHLLNTDGAATATFPLLGGRPDYEGEGPAAEPTTVDGVPGRAAAIRLDFDDVAGGSCGALLPTGRAVDEIEGVEVTLIDNGMPVVVVRASDLGLSGTESPTELEADPRVRARVEAIRLAAGPLMRLGDVTDTTVPKVCLVSAPVAGGTLTTRTFIPHRCHEAIGVFGAVSVGTAALLAGSPAASVAHLHGDPSHIVCEHPTGSFTAVVETETGEHGALAVRRAGIVRTARKLMDGLVFPRRR